MQITDQKEIDTIMKMRADKRDLVAAREAIRKTIEECTHDWTYSWEEYHGSCTVHHRCIKCKYEQPEHRASKCKKGYYDN